MEYRILGRTGLRVSAVALGCEGFIHKTPEEVCADFDFAIDVVERAYAGYPDKTANRAAE